MLCLFFLSTQLLLLLLEGGRGEWEMSRLDDADAGILYASRCEVWARPVVPPRGTVSTQRWWVRRADSIPGQWERPVTTARRSWLVRMRPLAAAPFWSSHWRWTPT
jgi:hypothetical protein